MDVTKWRVKRLTVIPGYFLFAADPCHEIAAQATIKIRRYCFVLKGDEHAYGIEC
jgi:hypothetical protein